ncbi:MAG: hypothetical protein KAT05_13715 [Spirochaetes bacterium]|nr:hypothetical protein [Spirochaetota bacterium]
MTKKTFLCIFIILFALSFSIAQDDTKQKTKQATENNLSEYGYDIFFTQNIGKEITVTISNLEITITGTLIAVYKDGIIVKSLIKKIFIPKQSIAFAKTKGKK